jgi:hypothetical protein
MSFGIVKQSLNWKGFDQPAVGQLPTSLRKPGLLSDSGVQPLGGAVERVNSMQSGQLLATPARDG